MHPRHHAQAYPQKPAVVFASGATLSYAELEVRANRTAHLLRARGLKQGDVIAIFLENEPDFFDIVWAAQRAGLYFVPVSSKLMADELAYILSDCGAKLLFASVGLAEVAQAACDAAALPPPLLTGAVAGGFEAERDGFSADPIADEASGTYMVYSSGTTGRPKGVKPPLPLGPVDGDTRMAITARTQYGVDADSVYLSPAPLYHAAPLRWCMTVQSIGGTVIVLDRFDAETVLRTIDEHRVTHGQFVPTHFSRLLALPEETRARYRHDSLRAVLHAAAPCPRPVKEAMFDWWGPILFEYYGGSEGNGITIALPEDWLNRPGTVGRAVGCEVYICDEDGEPVETGQTGGVYFANGPSFEYHNDADKTKQAYNRYGWSTLGDIGHLDEAGFLFLTDRKSFMIISGGVNIYPQEIEDCLLTHPAVADAAVVAAPHADLGEQVACVIEPKDWAAAGPALARDVQDFLRGRISHVKVPRRIDFLEEMPRLPTGKLMKRWIRDAYFGENTEIAAKLKEGTRR